MVMNSISQCALCSNYEFKKGLCPYENTEIGIPEDKFRNILPCDKFNGSNKESTLYMKRLWRNEFGRKA